MFHPGGWLIGVADAAAPMPGLNSLCRNTPINGFIPTRRLDGSPSFPGNPCACLPCSQTPGRPDARPLQRLTVDPASMTTESKPTNTISCSITRRSHSLPMPRAALTDDYAGLASGGGQPYRVGLVTHRIPMKDFLDRSFPPFLSFCWRDIL